MRWLGSFGPLLGLSAIVAVFASMYVLLGVRPPEDFERVVSSMQGLFIVYWIVTDARRRRKIPCHDFGFLVATSLPISLIWYLVWTRGFRGLWLIVLLVILISLPSLFATTIWYVKYNSLPF